MLVVPVLRSSARKPSCHWRRQKF